jgi:hypothetical protein
VQTFARPGSTILPIGDVPADATFEMGVASMGGFAALDATAGDPDA